MAENAMIRVWDAMRDSILHERGPLAEAGADSDIINAVLGIIDDARSELDAALAATYEPAGIPTAALEGEAKSVIDLLREARTWVADGCEYQSTEAAARALLDRIDAALAAGEKR